MIGDALATTAAAANGALFSPSIPAGGSLPERLHNEALVFTGICGRLPAVAG